MPRQPDNGFPSRGVGFVLLEALMAILASNALYFLVLAPHLPSAWQHQPFALDLGLLLDFLLCAGLYALVRRGRRWFDSRRRGH